MDDESYNGKTISYCSKKLGQSTSAFVGGYIAGIAAELGASNLVPSEELTNAYRDHVTKAARITVHFNPFEPFGIDTLSGMEPENLVDYLGVSALFDELGPVEAIPNAITETWSQSLFTVHSSPC